VTVVSGPFSPSAMIDEKNDAPAALRAHQRNGGAHGKESAGQVEIDDMGPVLELEFLDIARPLGPGPAGDVHQCVNAAETLVGAAHRVDRLAFVGHIGVPDLQPIGRAGKFRPQSVERALVGIDDEDRKAAAEQPTHGRLADAAGTACNDRRSCFHHAVHRSVFILED
jgi:hypothetical protein